MFCFVRDDSVDVLCIAEWGGTISFWTIAGRQIGRERMTNFIPLKVTHFPEGQYILVCGSNEKCLLMTHEGIQLTTVGEPFSSWVWSCAVHPLSSHVVRSSTAGDKNEFCLASSSGEGGRAGGGGGGGGG